MESKVFLGSGMKFPPQIDKNTGRFKVSEGQQNIKESIYIILMTQREERWTRPDFGSNILSYAFMDSSITMLSMMERDIRSTIMTQEPRVSELEINIEPADKDGRLIVNIDYIVADGYTMGSLVFPFYLDSGGGVFNSEPE